MDDLPAGLADPLHLLPPFPYRSLLLTVALLLLLAWWLWRRHRRARPKTIGAPVSKPLPPLPPPRIARLIDDIARRAHEARTYRQGCHELAEVLRQHFEAMLRQPLSTLTVSEIDAAVERPWLTRCFRQLARLQFARRVPEAGEFDDACELAREVTRQGAERR